MRDTGVVFEHRPKAKLFALSVLTVGALFGFTGTQMVAPLILLLAVDFNSSVAVVGQLVTASAVVWATLAPVCGALSDRYGRRSMLLLAAVIYGTFTILASWAWDLPSMFAMRMLAAVGGSLYATNLQTSIPDYFPRRDHGSALGWVNSGASMAPLVGVPLAAFIAAVADWHWSFRVIGAFLLVSGVLFYRALPDIPRQASARYRFRSTFSGLLRSRAVSGLLLCNMFERIMFAALTTYLATFLMLSYDLTVGEVAPLISFIAVGTVVSTWIGGRILGRSNPATIFSYTQAAAGLILLPLAWFTIGPWFSGLLAAGFGAANAFSRPGYMWMITRVAAPIRGAMMGLNVTSNQVGWALGSALGGLMIAIGGYHALIVVSCSAGLVAAVCCRLLVHPEALPKVGLSGAALEHPELEKA